MGLTLFDPPRGSNKFPVPSVLLFCCFILLSPLVLMKLPRGQIFHHFPAGDPEAQRLGVTHPRSQREVVVLRFHSSCSCL